MVARGTTNDTSRRRQGGNDVRSFRAFSPSAALGRRTADFQTTMLQRGCINDWGIPVALGTCAGCPGFSQRLLLACAWPMSQALVASIRDVFSRLLRHLPKNRDMILFWI
jgi:hypothetical protein